MKLLALFLALTCSACLAQELPDAPMPTHRVVGTFAVAQPANPVKAERFLGPVEISLIAADASARALDWASTEQFLRDNGYEAVLPDGLVRNKPAFAIFEAGMVAGMVGIEYWAYRKHRRRWGYVPQILDAGLTFNSVRSNYAQISQIQKHGHH